MRLRNRVVVITGASSGFGELIARRCVAQGARVVLAARSAPALEGLADDLGRAQALPVPTDVTSDTDVRRLVQQTVERFGQADVLVNNAGFGVMDRFEQAQLGDLQEMMEVNVYGAVRCTQAFLPLMRARRSGQIVMMASLAGLIATYAMDFYCATKFALVGMTRNLMVELHGSGVRCALICPGVAMTNFMRRADITKFPLITRITSTTAEQVADATLHAIARRTHGEVLVPWFMRPVVAVANLNPNLSQHVIRLVG